MDRPSLIGEAILLPADGLADFLVDNLCLGYLEFIILMLMLDDF